MSLKLANRVKEVTQVEGIGRVNLLGAVDNFLPFSSKLSNNDLCYYAIESQLGTYWEIGLGKYKSIQNALERIEVFSSSNNDNLVEFIQGSKHVFITYPSEKSVYLDEFDHLSGNLANQDFAGLLSATDKQKLDNLQLVTITRTEIINNKILLPSRPKGDFLFNLCIVYGTEGVLEYDDLTLLELDGLFYAVLNESELVEGLGVVSYLT